MSESTSRNPGRDTVPLSIRVAAMMLSRVVLTAVTYLASALAGRQPGDGAVRAVVSYLIGSALLSCTVLLPSRRWAISAFGFSLLLDGVYLQYLHETIGYSVPADAAIATHLIIVCLLASFRSGLAMAGWQTILMIFAVRGQQSGLFPTPGWSAGLNRDRILLVDCGILWVSVLAAALTAEINERELRRRRYDAEALRRFADQLQADARTSDVAARLCAFISDELLATRVLVCRQAERGWILEATTGLPAGLAGQPSPSVPALFSVPPGPDNEVLCLRLDPDRDPWLHALLPGARRLIAFELAAKGLAPAGVEAPTPVGAAARRWLVIEHAAIPGSRIATRLIATAAQAVATATIAISRAQLLQEANRAASTDGLTGLANRRRFDHRIAQLTRDWTAAGRPFALVLVDVDRFKSVNDRYGHQTGDHTLEWVAGKIAAQTRPIDLPARYGGEEFAILVPDSGVDQAVELAERVRVSLRAGGGPVPVTASFGVASIPVDAQDADALIWQADAALLHAKGTGRDRVVIAADALALSEPGAPAASAEPA